MSLKGMPDPNSQYYNQSTTLWQDKVSRTVADKTPMGVFLSYEEYDHETGVWYPNQRILIPTEQYKAFSKFLTK